MQAPHCPAPQPNLVPVSFKSSRSTHKSGVSGSAVTVWRLPLTVSDVLIIWDMVPPWTYSAITAGLVFVFLAGRTILIQHRETGGSLPGFAPYSMTLVACTRIERGTVMPSALAVFRLMTSSNFVGCSTGSSAGLAPFRILLTCVAASR